MQRDDRRLIRWKHRLQLDLDEETFADEACHVQHRVRGGNLAQELGVSACGCLPISPRSEVESRPNNVRRLTAETRHTGERPFDGGARLAVRVAWMEGLPTRSCCGRPTDGYVAETSNGSRVAGLFLPASAVPVALGGIGHGSTLSMR